MKTVSLARHAMATRFEIVLHGEDEPGLRAAGEEALDEISALEAQLNFHSADSEISRINAGAALGPVPVEPGLFRLLREAKRIYEQSGGAFDVTVAPLMRYWGFWGGERKVPYTEELAKTRDFVGMHLVHMNGENFTVEFEQPGVQIDLGAIGKGYALEEAGRLLRESGVSSALLHGGTSSVCAIGAPQGQLHWRIAIKHPSASASEAFYQEKHIALVELRDESMGVSSSWGRVFEHHGELYGHVLDPRCGSPTQNALLAAVVLPNGTTADAWSTALLVSAEAGLATLGQAEENARSLLMLPDNDNHYRLAGSGFEVVER